MWTKKKGVYWEELRRMVKEIPFLKDAKVALIDFDWCLLIDIGDSYDIEIFPEYHISRKRKQYNEVPWRLYLWEKRGFGYKIVEGIDNSNFESLPKNIEMLKNKKANMNIK